MYHTSKNFLFVRLLSFAFWGVLLLWGDGVLAATLRVSPDTGVYTAGATFSAQVLVNTIGKPVNAADGELTFNPRELSVVSVTRASSIFNLWTQEPTFSNSAGTITFGGGSPTGYTGTAGNVISITFRAVAAGTPKVTFKSASILAADGLGTNVLTAMTGATYSIGAQSSAPPPEYVPPANTPLAPKVTSTTHPDQTAWYQAKTALLSWTLPPDITAVRLLLDTAPATIPTNVYEERLTKRELTDLPQGVSYFHIQFKNSDGWGRVTHYRLAVDSEPPANFSITEATSTDMTSPERVFVFTIEDTSPIVRYSIQIDGGTPIEIRGEEVNGRYTLPRLEPGRHTVIVEAFDAAGNSRVATYGFDIAAFEPPVFTEYPLRLNTDVIPAILGTTRPESTVTIFVTKAGGQSESYTVLSDAEGRFTFIPPTAFPAGVYDLKARATDRYGAQSTDSNTVRIIVEAPGFIRVGSLIISVLSVLVPLVTLCLLLIFGTWYLWYRFRRWQRKISIEAKEAQERTTLELNDIVTNLNRNLTALRESRKSKITKAEQALIDELLVDVEDARTKISKEIGDIQKMIK